MTKRRVFGLFAVGAALLVASCSSGGGRQSAAPTTTAGATVVTAPQPVPVSQECGAAMRRVAGASVVEGTPSGEAAQVQDFAIARSLAVCTWRGEWLSAAADALAPSFTEPNRLALYRSFCDFGLSGRRRAVPLDAPSCVVLSASNVVANPRACPNAYSNTPLSTLNAGVAGLDKRLVPINAFKVRLCSYGPVGSLVGGKPLLTPIAAARFEDETNRLPPVPPSSRNARPLCMNEDHWVLTFAGPSQQVTVTLSGCAVAVATNGVLHARPTTKWLDEFQRYTAKPSQR